MAAVRRSDRVRRCLRCIAVDADHHDRPAVAQRPLVPGEIDELVHQREVEGAAEPAQPA